MFMMNSKLQKLKNDFKQLQKMFFFILILSLNIFKLIVLVVFCSTCIREIAETIGIGSGVVTLF